MSSQSGILLILTGVNSGAGKDSIMREILELKPEFRRIVTVNTRPMREDEIEGVDHYFKTQDVFERMLERGEFFESKEFAGHFYGTQKSEIEKVLTGSCLIWRIDPVMALRTHQSLINFFGSTKGEEIWSKTLTIFIDAQSKEVIKKRMIERRASPQEIEDRLEQVWEERNIVIDKFENVVLNEEGKLDEAVYKVNHLIDSFLNSQSPQ